ncbi:two-component system response regulator NarL [Motilimonas cestriensis]|uniref:Two-component system response regulator NarL n=1 Tax=Motilimonas cestriensis TaxID=2742685 RepID=A0ABS8WAZ9_9GAMM|nr:two-component system response regulator NarL [Motilimonas cestriensis]MCE2595418.1 two-component system response regulator NarL [Motilimonas cestriensis]
MAENKLSVIVVDDHPLMRRGITQLLTLDPELVVIGEASNGSQAIAMAKLHEPDLILLDLNMKGMSGLETLKALREENIDSRIIILTVSDAKQDVIALVNQGADGYLLKDTEPEDLLVQLKLAATGEQVFSAGVIEYLDCLEEDNHYQAKVDSLTKRELQILQQIAKGQSNKEIADQLHISEGTVKVHVKSLLKKCEAKSRVEAAVMYLEMQH